MSSLYQQSSPSFIASAGNLCGDSLAATARMHWYQAKISCKLPARRKLRWIGKEHTHICHDCVANARNCQKVLCISGLIGKPADFALKRLNPVVVAQTHVFENAGTLIEVEIAVAVLPMVYVEQAALFVVLQKVGVTPMYSANSPMR